MMNRFWTICLVLSGLIISDQLAKGTLQSLLAEGEIMATDFYLIKLAHLPKLNKIEQMISIPGFMTLFLLICLGYFFVNMVKFLRHRWMFSWGYALLTGAMICHGLDHIQNSFFVDIFVFYFPFDEKLFISFNPADIYIFLGVTFIVWAKFERPSTCIP
jgi:lipoprotein signal peptidase